MMSGTVFAAAEDKPNVTLNTNEVLHSLSLYTTPQQKFSYVEPDIGHLEPGVTTLRKLAEPYVTWLSYWVTVIISFVRNSLLSENKDRRFIMSDITLDWVAVIGFAGIIGLFLARGSRVKKLIYPTGLMAVSEQHSLYDFALQGYANIETFFKSATTPVEGKVSSSCQVQN
uniref:MICOS complex subunit n=1 Tax=Oncorhynchus mykiss TaxID=8022 RepID=A0A8C7V837_ONCMY